VIGARWSEARVGDALPPLALPPLTRTTLALYAGGSGDHIPLHIDSDFARSAGYPDVIMHGMLGAAYIGRVLTLWVPQECLRALAVRFTAITYPGEALTASATVAAVAPDGRVDLEVALRNAEGETKISGRATIELPTGSNNQEGR
jgi:acyl dehydratase